MAHSSKLISQYLYTVINQRPYLFRFHECLYNVLSPVPGSYPGYHVAISHHISLGSLWPWQFLRLLLVLMTLTVSRSAGWVFCRTSLNLDLSDVFLTSRLGLWFWGRRSQRLTVIFITSDQRQIVINMIYHCWCWPQAGASARVAGEGGWICECYTGRVFRTWHLCRFWEDGWSRRKRRGRSRWWCLVPGASLHTQPNPGERIGWSVGPGRLRKNVWASLLRLGQGWGLFCFAVGWAAVFIDMGLIQGDHFHSLQQHPLPEQTQEGSLEKHECDDWSPVHLAWVNTAWESDIVFPSFLRCQGLWGGDFSHDSHTPGCSLLVTAHASLCLVMYPWCSARPTIQL